MAFDPKKMRLGKRPPRFVVGIPRLSAVLADSPPPAPPKCDWTGGKTAFGVMGNDRLGDCTAAGVGHLFQIWTANAYGKQWTPTDEQVIEFYSESTGYDPKDPSTDQGGVETDVLATLQKDGFFGHHLVGHAEVDRSNIGAVKQAIYLAGGVYLGVALPKRIQTQGNTWRVPALSWLDPQSKPGSLGGHCVIAVGYDDASKLIKCISWGDIYYMSYGWFAKYADEAWVIIAASWIKNNRSPGGFDLPALQSYMLKKAA